MGSLKQQLSTRPPNGFSFFRALNYYCLASMNNIIRNNNSKSSWSFYNFLFLRLRKNSRKHFYFCNIACSHHELLVRTRSILVEPLLST